MQYINQKINFPVLVRSSYSLGGMGSGFANNEKEYRQLAEYIMSTGDSEDEENKTAEGIKELRVRDGSGHPIS